METNIPKINHASLEKIIDYYWKNFSPSPAIGIVGKPGIGKTETVYRKSQEFGFEYVYLNPVRKNPNTLTGVPKVIEDDNGGKKVYFAKWIPFETFHFKNDRKYVLHIDEFTNAPPTVQASLLSIILERQAEDFKIPDNVNIVVSGNLSVHSKASFDFIEPMPSRLSLFELLPPTAEEWSVWASANSVHPIIISFILSNPSFLLEEDGGILRATPRGWARAGKHLSTELSGEEAFLLVSSFVGERAGTQFRTFYEIKSQLPNIKEAFYLRDTKFLNALEKENFAVLYYTVSALATTNVILDVKQVQAFFEKLSPELKIITYRIWVRANSGFNNLIKTRLWEWFKNNILVLKKEVEEI